MFKSPGFNVSLTFVNASSARDQNPAPNSINKTTSATGLTRRRVLALIPAQASPLSANSLQHMATRTRTRRRAALVAAAPALTAPRRLRRGRTMKAAAGLRHSAAIITPMFIHHLSVSAAPSINAAPGFGAAQRFTLGRAARLGAYL